MPTVLITGANRGIGLELARQYAADGWRVIATARDPGAASELTQISGDVDVYPLEVTNQDSIDELAATLKGQAIDVLWNNAGIIGQRMNSIHDIDYEAWAEAINVNVFCPIKVCAAFEENVAASAQKKMAFTSSLMGSIERNEAIGHTVYRTSKGALNVAVKSLANEMAPKGIACVVMHPGHVRTDMGGPTAPVLAPDSAAGMRAVVEKLTLETTASFTNFDGSPIPW